MASKVGRSMKAVGDAKQPTEPDLTSWLEKQAQFIQRASDLAEERVMKVNAFKEPSN